MPIHITLTTLQKMIRPGLALRKESEGDCHVDISPDMIQLQVLPEDRTAHLNHTLHTATLDAQFDSTPSSFWICLEPIKDFLNAANSTYITVVFPFETDDSRMILQSADLTYWFPPQEPAYPLYDVESEDVKTSVSLHHRTFDQAVQGANIVGEKLQVHVDPDTRTVVFSAESTVGDDTFLYSLPADHINSIQGVESSLTISIDRLRNITPLISDATLASLQLMPHCLTYQIKHPTAKAELTLKIAQRHDIIQ